MASPIKLPQIFLCLAFCFLCFPSQTHSLSSVSISTTSKQTLICAIIPSLSSTQQSNLNCTSFPSGIQNPIKFSNVSYSRIVGGNGFLCALRSQSLSSPNSVMECWRFSVKKLNFSPKRVYRGPALSELEAGNSHVCGLVNGTNDLKCWQWRKDSNPESNSHSNFSSIAVGEDFVCGLDEKGKLSCLGNDTNVVNGLNPSGNYRVIGAGSHHMCAISDNGSLECWGNMGERKPEGEFMDLALGDNRSCALRINGTVVCWGESDFEMPTRLKEAFFTGIVAKKGVFCGVVSSNFSLFCWGSEILNNNGNDLLLVFPRVMPGSCETKCPCSPLPGYDGFCGQGLMVCQPCPYVQPVTPELSSPPRVAPPSFVPIGSKSSWNARMVVLLVVGCLGSVSLLATIAYLMLRSRRGRGSSRVHDSGPIEMAENPHGPDNHGLRVDSESQPVAPPVLEKRLSHMYSMGNGGTLEEFPLEVLLRVTNNFSQEHRTGIGSFGSVYRATLEDGREVAIKRAEFHVSPTSMVGIKRRQEDRDIAFLAELELLSRLNHKHLVRLHGFYEDANERVLVYEFMSNGTLYDHLHKLKGSSPLASWPTRLKVALDAARGIEYLHAYARPTIIHRDIKPSNILLDHEWTAKVSDFGLSLMGPQDGETHLSLWAAGTFGYVDPEYYRLHLLTTKSDVYSFGVVLLELLSGYKAIHTNEDGSHRNVVDFVVPYIMREEMHRVLDPKVPPPTPGEIEAVNYVGYLAVDCVNHEGQSRPSMSEVVGCLERALAACLTPPTLSPSSTTVSSR